jgi:hypothetical protein
MRMVKARGHLCFMAANLRVEEKDLETIIRMGVVTERWLYWQFISDAVTHVLDGRQANGKPRWKEHRVVYQLEDMQKTNQRIAGAIRRAMKGQS